MVNKIFPDSYAAIFRRFCLFCIYDAKVRIFRETTKLLGNYFSKKCEIGAVFHFFSFSLLTSAFSQIVKRETLLLYIIIIIYNNKIIIE